MDRYEAHLQIMKQIYKLAKLLPEEYIKLKIEVTRSLGAAEADKENLGSKK